MAGPDAYERTYLGSDEAIHRERTRSRSIFALLSGTAGVLGLFGLASLGAGIAGDWQGWGGAVLMGGLAATSFLAGVAISVSRAVVTPSELRLNHAFRDLRIPLATIASLSVGTFAVSSRIEARRDGADVWGASALGAGYVRVAWTDASGAARVVWVASDAPERLLAALERGRSAGAPGVRVAAAAADAAADATVAPDEPDAASEARRAVR